MGEKEAAGRTNTPGRERLQVGEALLHNKSADHPGQEANDLRARLREIARAHGVDLDELVPARTPTPAPLRRVPRPVAPPPRPRKLSGRAKRAAIKARREARRQADERADARTAQRLWDRLEAFGYETREIRGVAVRVARGAEWPVVTRALHRIVGAIMADPSGTSARRWFRACKHKAFAALIRDVAEELGGKKRTYHDIRARRVVALGALFVGMARRTNRKGRWRWLVEGLPRSLIQLMLRDPWSGATCLEDDGVPSSGALTGTYGEGRGGVIKLLRDAGATYSPDNAGLPKKFVTPSGYQPNQYWLLTDVEEFAPGINFLVERALAAEVEDAQLPTTRPRFTTGPP